MKLFLRISICLLVFNCASYPVKNNFKNTDIQTNYILNPYFSDSNHDYVYKANIEVYDNVFGGIFIVKKLGDQQHRIVFTTEMGNKLFDFSFDKETFKVNYILDDLNKKILINILKKDFKILITERVNALKTYTLEQQTITKSILNKKTYYYYKTESLEQIIRAGRRKEKVRFSFTEISDNFAKQIEIKHSNIKLKINLRSIQ